MRRRRFTVLLEPATRGGFVRRATREIHRIGYLGGTLPSAEPYLFEGFFEGLRVLDTSKERTFCLRDDITETASNDSLHSQLNWFSSSRRLSSRAGHLRRKQLTAHAGQSPSSWPIIRSFGAVRGASLARVAGNVTGMSMLMPELVGKQLQLLKEAIPGMSRAAVLSNPTVSTNALLLKEAEATARSTNAQLQVLDVRAPGDFDGGLLRND